MEKFSHAGEVSVVSFLSLIKRPVYDNGNTVIGRVEDGIMSPHHGNYPVLDAIIVSAGNKKVKIPASSLDIINGKLLADPDSIAQGEIDGLYIRKDILGCRLLDLRRQSLVKAYDVRIQKIKNNWMLTGLDVHRHGWFNLGSHQQHSVRDWKEFILLTLLPGRSEKLLGTNRMHRIKPAKLADLIEEASPHEQHLILSQLHSDPDLEAHVFEEIGDEGQVRLFRNLSDQDVANVLGRMRTDDAADAVMDLPQTRRGSVLQLLPEHQSRKIHTLLGYNDATAGGLMGTDYLALPETETIENALNQIRTATTLQPEALTSIFSVRPDGTLGGVLGIVRALQLEPSTLLRDAVDTDVVFALPEDDIVTITTRMSDFNLLNLPVLDRRGVLLGIVTVDDALEVAIPRDWFQRRHPLPLRHNGEDQ